MSKIPGEVRMARHLLTTDTKYSFDGNMWTTEFMTILSKDPF